MWGAVAAGPAAGGHATIAAASRRMARLSETRFRPLPEHRDAYDALYGEYVRLHDLFGRGGDDVMRRLKGLRSAAAGSTL